MHSERNPHLETTSEETMPAPQWAVAATVAAVVGLGAASPGLALDKPITREIPSASRVPATDSPEMAWWREAMTTHDKRIAWWREARFGMFIHWGVYSELGGEWHGQPVQG